MRARILVSIVALGVLVTVALVLLRPRPAVPPQDSPEGLAAEASAEPASNALSEAQPAPAPAAGPGLAPAATSQSAPANAALSGSVLDPAQTPLQKHEAYVEQRVSELAELSMADDSASLESILSELSNSEPAIRKAAVEAAVQFGSRDAIPRLEEAMLHTDDSQEKARLKEAVDFLRLPSLTEVLAEKQKAAQAAAPAK